MSDLSAITHLQTVKFISSCFPFYQVKLSENGSGYSFSDDSDEFEGNFQWTYSNIWAKEWYFTKAILLGLLFRSGL